MWQKEKLLVLSNFFFLSLCFQKAVCCRKHLYEGKGPNSGESQVIWISNLPKILSLETLWPSLGEIGLGFFKEREQLLLMQPATDKSPLKTGVYFFLILFFLNVTYSHVLIWIPKMLRYSIKRWVIQLFKVHVIDKKLQFLILPKCFQLLARIILSFIEFFYIFCLDNYKVVYCRFVERGGKS